MLLLYLTVINANKLNVMRNIQYQFNAIELWEKWDKNDLKHERYSLYQFLLKEGTFKASSYLMGPNKKKKVIYFLYNRKKLVYIGQTERENQYLRPVEHINDEKSPKIYDEIRMWIIPENICLDTLESMLIFQNNPFYNKTYVKGGTPVDRMELTDLIKKYKIRKYEKQ